MRGCINVDATQKELKERGGLNDRHGRDGEGCNSERIEGIIQYAHRTAQLLNGCNSERIEGVGVSAGFWTGVGVDATQKELKDSPHQLGLRYSLLAMQLRKN